MSVRLRMRISTLTTAPDSLAMSIAKTLEPTDFFVRSLPKGDCVLIITGRLQRPIRDAVIPYICATNPNYRPIYAFLPSYQKSRRPVFRRFCHRAVAGPPMR